MPSRLIAVPLLAVVFVLVVVGSHWDPTTGFTSLIRFGRDFDERRLPQLESQSLAIAPGAGYDGQFYAQLAVKPDITDPALQRALDLPAYRARRILLPLVAFSLGGGNTTATLQIYALLNVAAWLALAWCWWRWLPERDGRGAAAWLACMLSLGVLDSVRLSLTDLPMLLALVLAIRALECGRNGLAATAFVAAGFIRETAVLVLNPVGVSGTPGERRAAWRLAVLCGTPVAMWAVWAEVLSPGPSGGFNGNFDWPGFAFARHLIRCVTELSAGNLYSRYIFGLIGGMCMAYQSVYLLRRWRDPDPWLRLGLPFALLFWLLGDYVWYGYGAVARATLPMLFVFNRAVLTQAHGVLHLALGNFFVAHSIYRFLLY